jgi:hypothetical protein
LRTIFYILRIGARRTKSSGEPNFAGMWEAVMNRAIALSALLVAGLGFATTERANAVVYCKYIGYPKGCVAQPGVVLVARPVVTPGVGAPGVGVRPGRVGNRGGPVNRVGRR